MDLFMKVEAFFEGRRKRKVVRLQTELAVVRTNLGTAVETYKMVKDFEPTSPEVAKAMAESEATAFNTMQFWRTEERSLTRKLDSMRAPYEVIT